MAAKKRDYYKILEVEKTCTIDEIKKSYRKLARQFHPDVNNGDSESADKFKEISEAYAVLSNEEKRRQYDNFGYSGSLFEDFNADSVFSEFGFGDIFNMFFGGFGGNSNYSSRGSSRRQSRGSNVETKIDVNLKEAAFGIEKEIEYHCTDLCEDCKGTGSETEGGVDKCKNCGGTGQVRHNRQTIIGNIVTTSACSVCSGTGEIIKNPCKKCQGKGYVKQKKSVKVKIPSGISNGDSIRIAGRGNALGRGSIAGDLFVQINIEKHPLFSRKGNDIISELNISFTQAILGSKLEVEIIDGKEDIVVEPGTQPNTRYVLKSRGIVELNGYRRGDHIINVNIKIPTKLSKEEIESLKRIAENNGETVGDGTRSFFSNLKEAFRK